jgi:hypothetical protein
MLSLLSIFTALAGSWGPRLSGIKAATSRFNSGHIAIACAVAVAVLAVGVGVAIAARRATDHAVEKAEIARDTHWRAALMTERNAVLARQMARDRASAAAAAAARQLIAKQRDAAEARLKTISDALDASEEARRKQNAVRAASGRKPVAIDPVVWPKSVAKALK